MNKLIVKSLTLPTLSKYTKRLFELLLSPFLAKYMNFLGNTGQSRHSYKK